MDPTSVPPSPPDDLREVAGPAPMLASFARVLAHRPGAPGPNTSVRPTGLHAPAWRPRTDLVQRYADVVGSGAALPLTFPAVVVTQLYRDLLGGADLPVNGMGLVHVATTLWASDSLPATSPWQVSAWVERARHTRSGLEIDLGARCAANDASWTSRMVVLARAPAARGAEATGSPDLPDHGDDWGVRAVLDAPADAGRRYAEVSGDYNPIHLHPATARLFGFARAIAHGWWVLPRALALLGADESPRRGERYLEVAYVRPVMLPSRVSVLGRVEDETTAFVARRDDGKPHFGGRLTRC
jgi:acyl dehydratase